MWIDTGGRSCVTGTGCLFYRAIFLPPGRSRLLCWCFRKLFHLLCCHGAIVWSVECEFSSIATKVARTRGNGIQTHRRHLISDLIPRFGIGWMSERVTASRTLGESTHHSRPREMAQGPTPTPISSSVELNRLAVDCANVITAKSSKSKVARDVDSLNVCQVNAGL
jgi:hypothetical protein